MSVADLKALKAKYMAQLLSEADGIHPSNSRSSNGGLQQVAWTEWRSSLLKLIADLDEQIADLEPYFKAQPNRVVRRHRCCL